jgi:hypothetical protein
LAIEVDCRAGCRGDREPAAFTYGPGRETDDER